MNSSARFWAAIVLLASLSLAGKVWLDDRKGSEVENEQAATRDLQAFLVSQKVEALATVRIRPRIPLWAGWRFKTGGCGATTFPLPMSGELNASARDHAQPGDRVAFLYSGRTSAAAPLATYSIASLASDLIHTTRLTDPAPQFYVIVIYPAACDAVLRLPWRSLQ